MNIDTAPLCNVNQAERKFASELILWITGRSLSGLENTNSFYEGFCRNVRMYVRLLNSDINKVRELSVWILYSVEKIWLERIKDTSLRKRLGCFFCVKDDLISVFLLTSNMTRKRSKTCWKHYFWGKIIPRDE